MPRQPSASSERDEGAETDAQKRASEQSTWYGVPPLTELHVPRPRLTALLDDAEDKSLVLLSSPAGTGKSSLVAEWLHGAADRDPTAWVTYEAAEKAFWPDVVHCLDRLGAGAPGRGFPAGTSPVDRQVLLSLTGALARLPRRVTLVVDGYELCDPAIATDLDFLLRHSGHRLRLVLMTRADPVLPLYRYRLDETLTELRIADLSFTDEEAARLLVRSGITLTAGAVHTLNAHTAGWAVGLRFATRILAARDDPEQAVDDVTKETGNIDEYLVGEVLNSQTPEVRQLLLSTSVPETLQPGLTEELVGRAGTRTLALLTKANAFIEPVPEHPGFYRYHPFFRDLLRAELAYESPGQLEELHRRTAEWFARAGLVREAVKHFAAVGAWEDAAGEVVEQLAIGDLLLGGADGALALRMASIPVELLDASACVVRAALALADGDRQLFGEQLDLAVACRDTQPKGRHDRSLLLCIEVLEVVRSRDLGDPGEALAVVERAETVLNARENRGRVERHPELSALVLAGRGSAQSVAGRLAEAYDAFAAAAAAAGASATPGVEALLVECLGRLAVLDCFRGQISGAETYAHRAAELADSLGIAEPDRSPAGPSALAWVGALREDLRTATEQIAVAERAEPLFFDPAAGTLLTVAKARVQAARGDVAGALHLVREPSARDVGQAPWMIDTLRLETGHLHVVKGEPDLALLDLESVHSTGSEPEVALVASQAALAGGAGTAPETLERALRPEAPLVTQVEAWLVEATRQARGGSAPAARSAVERALQLASHDRLRMPFRRASGEVRRLVKTDLRLQAAHPWLAGDRRPSRRIGRATPAALLAEAAPQTPVVEKLTGKELEVLGHLAELLTTEEIAEAMFVSVNTIRTHVRSILRKLGVSRRNAAVRRARELELLPV